MHGIHNPVLLPEKARSVVDPPPVHHKSHVIPLHPGPLVPVKIHDVHDPGIIPDTANPLAEPPTAEQGHQGIPLGFAEPRVL